MSAENSINRSDILVIRQQDWRVPSRFPNPSSRRFDTRSKVVDWIMEGQDYSHDVSFPFTEGQPVEALLVEQAGEEYLMVALGDKVGAVPRTVSGHHAISTNYTPTQFYLCVQFDRYYDNPITDRGLTWVRFENPNDIRQTFTILAGSKTREQIEAAIHELNGRAIEVFNNILNSTVDPDPRLIL